MDGNLRKNGGNVASCFCTADARVIHAVGGPVSADRLLEEARWAIDVYQRAQGTAPLDNKKQSQVVEEAHLAELHATPQAFYEEFYKQLPKAREDYYHKRRDYARQVAYRRPLNLVPPEVTARQQAAEHFRGDRAHQIMAAQPLASFQQTRERIFEKLTGELYAERRDRVYLAAEGLKAARENGKPMLLVLYKGHGKDKDEYDDATKKLLGETFCDRTVSIPLESFVVIALPLRQLAALTQLADLPNYEFGTKSSPNLIITRADGMQVTTLHGMLEPAFLASQLWPLAGESVLNHAEQLVEKGEFSDALRLLHGIAEAPLDMDLRGRVQLRIANVMYQLAEHWASDGRTTSALRMFVRLQKEAPTEDLRQRAGEQVTRLRAELKAKNQQRLALRQTASMQ